MPARTYLGNFRFKSFGSKGLKRTYIVANRPPYASLVPTYNRLRADPTWSFATIEAGHDSMVTAPDELASLLVVA
jgi:hypothetical protein